MVSNLVIGSENPELSLSLFFIPPILLLAALDFEKPASPSVRVVDIPFEACEVGFSGEACLTMYLQSRGHEISQEQVFRRARIDVAEGRGCRADELVRTARHFGIEPGPVWHSFPADSRHAHLQKIWRECLADLKAERPSVLRVFEEEQAAFVLLTGYLPETDEVIVHDPRDEGGNSQRRDRTTFLSQCVCAEIGEPLELVRLRLEGDLPQSWQEFAPAFSDADYAQHVRKLKGNLPPGDFHVLVEKPFVVIGDESLSILEQRSRRTIKWAVDRLKRDYFLKDPNQIVDIWLFKNKASYQNNVERLVGYAPTTKFGFYSSRHAVLVMNISTGGGTLVHEIVHPFMESNFPACPSWFNEGLASLYEQCRDRDGHIWGSTNWRLRGLQGAIQSDRLPSFQELCSTSRGQFYHEDPGTHYAQSRYLCYYLQEKGLLKTYYETFRVNAKTDPTGFETLREVLGQPDMDAFQREWETYVMKLTFP